MGNAPKTNKMDSADLGAHPWADEQLTTAKVIITNSFVALVDVAFTRNRGCSAFQLITPSRLHSVEPPSPSSNQSKFFRSAGTLGIRISGTDLIRALNDGNGFELWSVVERPSTNWGG